MQRDIRLIGLDLDNTVLNEKKEITPRVRASIENAIKAGITVLPATGRSLAGVPEAFLSIPGVRYALTSNGAKVYDMSDKSVVLSNCFSKSDAVSILELCEKYQSSPAVFIDGVVYSGPVDYVLLQKHFGEPMIDYIRASRKEVPNLRELIIASESPVEKISLTFYDLDERAEAKKVFLGREDCTVTSSLPGNLELNAAGANKGTALLQLGQMLGIAKEQVMAVGDGTNDLEMLQAVGYAVAMSNAHADVLKAAHWVTTSYEEDGVAVAIEAVMPNKK